MIDIEKLRAIYKLGKDVSLEDGLSLLRAAGTERIKRRTTLIEQGSKSTKVYFLRKGLVRAYHIKDNGEEITFDLIPEHHLAANIDFIVSGLPSNLNFETFEDCEFYTLNYDVLESIVSNNPKLEANRKFFLRKLLMQSKERIESFVLMNPEERYLKFLKDFPGLSNRVPDKYIAQVLGITPVSLSRIRGRIASRK